MKNWFNEHKDFFKSWKFKLGLSIFLILVVAGIIFGMQIYGYMMAAGVFLLFYYFTLQAQAEHVLSPKEMQQMEEDLAQLIEDAEFIREHIAENPSDLEAKLMLRELEQEIENLENAIPKE